MLPRTGRGLLALRLVQDANAHRPSRAGSLGKPHLHHSSSHHASASPRHRLPRLPPSSRAGAPSPTTATLQAAACGVSCWFRRLTHARIHASTASTATAIATAKNIVTDMHASTDVTAIAIAITIATATAISTAIASTIATAITTAISTAADVTAHVITTATAMAIATATATAITITIAIGPTSITSGSHLPPSPCCESITHHHLPLPLP